MTRRLAFQQLADLHRQLADVYAQIASDDDATDAQLVDVLELVPGARRSERRALQRACREGQIVGAMLLCRRWRAPRLSVVAYLRQRGPRVVEVPEAEGDDLQDTRARLLGPAKAPAPRRARRSR